MKISIAMTTFNGEKYLEEQLRSIAAQTRIPDELVVHDDRSEDRTVEILHDFKQSAPFPVHIVENQKTLGYTANFEAALSACKGDLIFLADQDDSWFPQKIAAMESVFQSQPELLLAIHDGELTDENLTSTGTRKLAQIRAGYSDDTGFATGALTVLRPRLLHYALPIPAGVIGHDGWLHYTARMFASRRVIDNSLQFIRRHSSNTSQWIANSLETISRTDVLMHLHAEVPASSYADRLIYNDALRSRLDEAVPSRVGDRLNAERMAIVRREALLKRNWLGRKLAAGRMLLSGNYRHFNGIWSLLRDIAR
jgi:glycosyltransferase involved in cell wall biosynthesis